MTTKITHAMLGRFAPIHKGHQMVIDKLIRKFGIENCLIIIGSSTSLNPRTPFTFVTRKKMIKTLYPEITVIGLKDTNPGKEDMGTEDMDLWLSRLKTIELKSNSKFMFYGGSFQDIGYLDKEFETKIFVDRKIEGQNISATAIRNNLMNAQNNRLHDTLDERIIDIVTKEFHRF